MDKYDALIRTHQSARRMCTIMIFIKNPVCYNIITINKATYNNVIMLIYIV